jgi:putative DNA primase/helicase
MEGKTMYNQPLTPDQLRDPDYLASLTHDHAKRSEIPPDAPANEPIDSLTAKVRRNNLDTAPKFLDIGKKGAILDSLPNTRELLKAGNVALRHNLMSREAEYSRLDFVQLKAAGKAFEYRGTDLGDHIELIAKEDSYHPVKHWVLSKAWDKVDRFEALASTIVSDMSDRLKKLLLGKWLIQCIELACADNPKPAQGVLTFAGAQGIGKTTWIRKLCPIDGAIKTGISLDVHDRDSKHMACQYWITELGELDSTLKRDLAALKAFLTESSDRYRLPYASTYETYTRRTSFFASVNKRDFLKDETGNRRWWVIPVSSIDHAHTIDVQQLWAQVYTWWDSGTAYWLNSGDLDELNQHNEQFEEVDPIQQLILMNFLPPAQAAKLDDRYNATQIAKLVGINTPTKRDTSAISNALRKIGYQELARKVFAMPAPLPKPII